MWSKKFNYVRQDDQGMSGMSKTMSCNESLQLVFGLVLKERDIFLVAARKRFVVPAEKFEMFLFS